MKNIGGIYCIFTLGEFYDSGKLNSVRWRLRTWVGETVRNLAPEVVDFHISATLKGIMDGLIKMDDRSSYETFAAAQVWFGDNGVIGNISKTLYKKLQEFVSQIKDSYGYAIFHNGKRVASGDRSGDLTPRGKGDIEDFFIKNEKKSILARDLNQKGWAIMVVVAHDVAARLESTGIYPDNKYRGQGQTVLSNLIPVIYQFLKTRLKSKNSPDRKIGLQYGYILSRQDAGYNGRPLRIK